MLLVERVLTDRLVMKREHIYCAGLSAFLWKICWCCASMFSLILLCFCLRIPFYAFCQRFAVFVNHSFHCSISNCAVYLKGILQFNLGEGLSTLQWCFLALNCRSWFQPGLACSVPPCAFVEMEDPFPQWYSLNRNKETQKMFRFLIRKKN